MINLLIFLTYSFSILGLLLLWIKRLKNISFIFLFISIITALLSGILELTGVINILVTVILIHLSFKSEYKALTRIFIFIVTAIALFLNYMHVLPGFNNLSVLKDIYISKDAIPFTLYLNYSSIVITYYLIYFAKDISLIDSLSSIPKTIKQGLIYGLVAIAILLPISVFLKFIRFDFKFTSYTVIFIFVNLIFTCISEEIFWRGFIQTRIKKYTNPVISLLIASVIFAFIHIMFAGIYFAILAFIASLIYGLAYIKTKKIEVSILCHYMVNLGQFIFFTYPILASVYPN